jgi:hypothetical protein
MSEAGFQRAGNTLDLPARDAFVLKVLHFVHSDRVSAIREMILENLE